MATSKEFLNNFIDKMKAVPDVTYRPMMGEYVLYYRGKVIGGIYDNRVLIKPVDGLNELLPEATLRIPYEGAKPMVFLETHDIQLVKIVFEFLYSKLPEPKPKRKKN